MGAKVRRREKESQRRGKRVGLPASGSGGKSSRAEIIRRTEAARSRQTSETPGPPARSRGLEARTRLPGILFLENQRRPLPVMETEIHRQTGRDRRRRDLRRHPDHVLV